MAKLLKKRVFGIYDPYNRMEAKIYSAYHVVNFLKFILKKKIFP